MIVRDDPKLSVRQQCDLLGIWRSGLYYAPAEVRPEDLAVMRLLDEQYTRTPFYGVRRMHAWLRSIGNGDGIQRVRRLLRKMGLTAIHPKPHLSFNGTAHRRYPYFGHYAVRSFDFSGPCQPFGREERPRTEPRAPNGAEKSNRTPRVNSSINVTEGKPFRWSLFVDHLLEIALLL